MDDFVVVCHYGLRMTVTTAPVCFVMSLLPLQ
jgi:hypothetical protein